MKTFDITTQIFIFKMADLKEEILSAIDTMDKLEFRDNNQSISNTDWNLDGNIVRPYGKTVVNAVLEKVNTDNPIVPYPMVVNNFWFQQYEHNDWHGWHTHGDSVYSSVYYVELPERTQTTFIVNGESIQLDVEEGDFVVFPSFINHCSKPNKTNKRKTIISLNLNLD